MLQSLIQLLPSPPKLTLMGVVDIFIVAFLIYELILIVRGTRAAHILLGILTIVFIYNLALWLRLDLLHSILSHAMPYMAVAVIVLFQSEIRQALITFGNRFRLPFAHRHGGQFGEGVYDEIVLAATTLASTKTGALIVIERNVGLKNVTEGGVKLDAELSYDLLVTIFNPESPLHDGAIVVRRHRVAAASCFLPLTLNPRLSKDLGTRHRAAIGDSQPAGLPGSAHEQFVAELRKELQVGIGPRDERRVVRCAGVMTDAGKTTSDVNAGPVADDELIAGTVLTEKKVVEVGESRPGTSHSNCVRVGPAGRVR